jgi:hypothetical protein
MDWTPLINVSLRLDPLARRLAEIEQVEWWLDLEAGEALAQCDAVAVDPEATRRLAQACLLVADALLRDVAGGETRPGTERIAALDADYRSGAIAEDKRRLWERRSSALVLRARLLEAASTEEAPANFDGAALVAEALAIDEEGREAENASSPYLAPPPEDLAGAEARLARYRGLIEKAAPNPSLVENLCVRAGVAAYRLGVGWRKSRDFEPAIARFEESAAWYERGGEIEQAAESWRAAEYLRHAAAHDIDGASAEELRRALDGALAPVERARALARLSQLATAANAPFDAAELVERAASQLVLAGFADPESEGIEVATARWIAGVGKSFTEGGGRPEQTIADIGKLWADIVGARHGRAIATDPARADRLERLIDALGETIIDGLGRLAAAHDAVAGKLARYLPNLERAPPRGPPDDGFARATHEISNRLYEIQVGANEAEEAKDSAGLKALLARTEVCLADARRLGDPFAVAHALFIRAYIHDFMDTTDLAIASAEEGEAALLGGAPASPDLLLDHAPFGLLLDLREMRVGGLLRRGDDEARLMLARETVAMLEARRRNFSDPLQQAAFLSGRTFFYEMYAHAAFRLKRWDDLVAAMDLAKARIAAPDADAAGASRLGEIESRLAEAKKTRDGAANGSEERQTASSEIRLLIQARAIAKRAATPASAVSAQLLQAALAPEEATIGWLWASRDVLIVVAIRPDDVRADHIVLTQAVLLDLEAYVALLGAASADSADLEAIATRLVSAMFPESIRQFVAGARRLTLSPHRALHLLPFHALRWDEGGFLIQRAAISYAPNFGCLLVPNPKEPPSVAGGVLAIGVDHYACPGENWPDLRLAQEEAEAVGAIWRANGLPGEEFVAERATVANFENLRERLATCRCLHIAAHGVSVFAPEARNDPYASRLVLRDGSVDALQIGQLRLRADLVVLSACHAGQRALEAPGLEQLPGDDMFGLPAAFFEAGARAAIGALWPVHDAVAKRMMAAFHLKFATGAPADIALQQAMTAELRRVRGRVFLWAPFFLIRVRREIAPRSADPGET